MRKLTSPILSFALLLFVLVALFAVTPAFAFGLHLQEGTPPEISGIEFLTKLLFGLVLTVPGFTSLGVIVINLLKIPGWITDGNTVVAMNVFNVLSAVAIGLLTLFAPSVNITGLDETFGKLSGTLTVLLPTFVLLYKWLAPYIHNAIRGFPGIGYSYTLANAAKAKKESK